METQIQNYASEEVACGRGNITDKTKAYIGPLFPGIFTLGHIEYINTETPGGIVHRESIVAGRKTGLEYRKLFDQKGILVKDSRIEEMLNKRGYVSLEEPERIDLIRLSVGAAGFSLPNEPTALEFFERVKGFGLELCPSEVLLDYPLQIPNLPEGGTRFIGIELESSVGVSKSEIFKVSNYSGILVVDYFSQRRGKSGYYNWNTPLASHPGQTSYEVGLKPSFEFVLRLPKQT
jgi:hypothetical protein